MRSTSAFLGALVLVSACDDGGNSGDQTTRHAIGKADLSGACTVDDCGDQSAGGNCWCDSECAAFGDCCENVTFVCEAPAPSCDDTSTHSPLCDVPPICDDGLVKALKNGCFVCVDPQTCETPAPAACAAPACGVGMAACAEGTQCLVIEGCASPVCATRESACAAIGCALDTCGLAEVWPAHASCASPE